MANDFGLDSKIAVNLFFATLTNSQDISKDCSSTPDDHQTARVTVKLFVVYIVHLQQHKSVLRCFTRKSKSTHMALDPGPKLAALVDGPGTYHFF